MLTRNRLAAITLGAAALGVAGAPAASSTAASHPAAVVAARALLAHPESATAAPVPKRFAVQFGYRPQVRDGLLGNPGGGCSSPVPLPAEFTPACRQHDLGYDLLRYADASGEPLPGATRRALDAHLAKQNRAACTARRGDAQRAACRGWATVADAVVRVNTWRQNDGVPGPETPRSVLTVAGFGIAGIGTVALTGSGLRRRGGAR